jgi:protein gp37
LHEPQQVKKPQRIFVVSMGDLFGEWVPDSWIEQVFKACKEAPQHKYLFLTKNPGRFQDIFLTQKLGITNNMWFGFTAENQKALSRLAMGARWLPRNSFISVEPIQGPIDLKRIEPDGIDAFFNFLDGGRYWFMGGDKNGKQLKWIIIGQQTGPGAVPPKDEWVQSIIDQCRAANVPVFVKSPLYEKFPIQEWPEGLK